MVDAHEMVGANIRRMIDAGRLNRDQFLLVEHALECTGGCQTLLSDLVGPNYICRIVYFLLRETSTPTPKLTALAATHQKGCGICTTFQCELAFNAHLHTFHPQTVTIFKIVRAIVERAVLGEKWAQELIVSLREPTALHRWEQVVAYTNMREGFGTWLYEVDNYGLEASGRVRPLDFRQTPEVLGHGVKACIEQLEPLYQEVMQIEEPLSTTE